LRFDFLILVFNLFAFSALALPLQLCNRKRYLQISGISMRSVT